MKTQMIIRVFLALLLTMKILLAQATTEFPGGPALNRAPDFSSWKITCHQEILPGQPATAGTDTPVQKFDAMTVVKTKNLRSVETTSVTAGSIKRFYVGTFEALNPPGTITPRFYNGKNSVTENDYIDFSQTDFPECSWVNDGLFTGIEVLSGHKCLVFKDKGTDPSGAHVAYVDLDTRLPVKCQVGSLAYSYEFLAPPTEMLTIPALMRERIDFENRQNKNLSAHPAQY